jgi:hypothetical protein
LRPDRAASDDAALAAAVASLRWIAAARLRGRLYDLGPYPGAVFDAGAPGFVHGDLVELGPASPPLAWFDAYEGALFRRERHHVQTAAAAHAVCWSWALVRVPQGARPLEAGVWAAAE